MNMKMPEFNVKKLVKEAGSTLSRVVQLTEEKLGTSEKTELDAHFENLADRADSSKIWTEKILRGTESVLTPNPGNRAEDFIFEKIEKRKPVRLSNLEYLGLDMIEAGGEFGQDGAYGGALIKVGQAEQILGQTEREFITAAENNFIQPLRRFLEGEMRTILREKGILETKRLDLDSCKSRVRKARSMVGQQAKDGIAPEIALEQAERELRVAQSEFDRQAEITKLLLEGISTSRDQHIRHLHAFVEAQVLYYAQSARVMNDLQCELANLSGYQSYIPIKFVSDDTKGNKKETEDCNSQEVSHDNECGPNTEWKQRARVLCSYDAKDSTELNLNVNEILLVMDCNPVNTDYMFGKQGLINGLVPRAFLELLDE